jgi:RimJ/RimL family protein N-acetyltransferase
VDAPEPWPLRHLVLRTPRLELRPDDDAGLLELVEEAHHGVHPPEEMPFSVPWTDADPHDLGRGALQFYWGQRAQLATASWTINFLVRFEGRVVGMQGLIAREFRVVPEVETGSWVGLRHQGRGIGTEMRAAVLAFAFDHLGALRARSGAFTDNAASRRVSAKLGYRPDGSLWTARREQRAEQVRLLLVPDEFARPDWTLQVEGLDACRSLLGVA